MGVDATLYGKLLILFSDLLVYTEKYYYLYNYTEITKTDEKQPLH